MGQAADLRGTKSVQKYLARQKDLFDKASKEEKRFFDKDRLVNPYADSAILYDNKKEVKKILVGIDIDTAEILLAKELGVDLVISHHPRGKALANVPQVIDLQVEVLAGYGVPVNVAEGLFKVKISEVARNVGSKNYNSAVDAAQLLDINFICCHTICDNLVADFLKKQISKKKFEYVGDLMKLFNAIPEYEEARKMGAGPMLFSGHENNRCGKIAITEITGGTEGNPQIYEKMANAGIGTIIGMHISEQHKEEAEKNHLNALIAGHMSSDSIGVNLLLDQLEKKKLEIIPCSGLIRHKRI